MAMPNYKDIVELVKKGATLEAQEKLMELRESALQLQEENLALRTEVAELKAQLDLEKSFTFDGDIYWRDTESGKDGPFCPKCHDSDEKIVLLHKDGEGWWCHTCTTGFCHSD